MSDFKNRRTVKVSIDWEGYDSAGVHYHTQVAHGTGVFIPNNAIVLDAFYEVTEEFASAGDAAVISMGIQADTDLCNASAEALFTAGLHGLLAGSPVWGNDAAHDTAIEVAALRAASYIKTDHDAEIIFTVATADHTAGTLTLYVTYVMGE
jgi:hypothetical protein